MGLSSTGSSVKAVVALTPEEVPGQNFLVGHVLPLYFLVEELVSTEAYLATLSMPIQGWREGVEG